MGNITNITKFHDDDKDYPLREDDSSLERWAVRKMDYVVLPIMFMFFLLSFLDRVNIGNARVAGFQTYLGLSDMQYQICITITFVPYICAELPANLVLRRIGPKYLMPSLITVWGVIVVLQGFVSSYSGLIAARFFLGLVEGPMFPGIVLFLSSFYTRAELSFRIAVFSSSSAIAGAFSGLLAAAIANMDGIGNKPGWAWIFILEGLFTVLFGLLSFLVVPSTPNDLVFQTPEEKEILIRRLERDRPSMAPGDHFTFKDVIKSITSPHVVMIFIMFYMNGTILFGLAFYLPSIVRQLGFTPIKSQLLSAGPFGAGFFVIFVTAYISDRFKIRAIPIAVVTSFTLAGYAVFLSTDDAYTAYGAMFLAIMGVYGPSPIIAAWLANNSEPHYRRATSIALGFVATNSGGITSTWLFPTQEGPKFTKTTILNIVFSCMIIIGAGANALYLSYQNKQKIKNRYQILAPYLKGGQDGDGGMQAWSDLGDQHPDFVYST